MRQLAVETVFYQPKTVKHNAIFSARCHEWYWLVSIRGRGFYEGFIIMFISFYGRAIIRLDWISILFLWLADYWEHNAFRQIYSYLIVRSQIMTIVSATVSSTVAIPSWTCVETPMSSTVAIPSWTCVETPMSSDVAMPSWTCVETRYVVYCSDDIMDVCGNPYVVYCSDTIMDVWGDPLCRLL